MSQILIRREPIKAEVIGRYCEPMVVGIVAKTGASVCLHIADSLDQAQALAADPLLLQEVLDNDHREAVARGYDDDSRFVIETIFPGR